MPTFRKYPTIKQMQILRFMANNGNNTVFKEQLVYKNNRSFKKAMKNLILNDVVRLTHLKIKNVFMNQYCLTVEGKFFIYYISEWK